MNMVEESPQARVLLSIQRALWDLVTPSLRAIAVRVENHAIQARFLYEEVSSSELEIVSEIEAYVAADFVFPVEPAFRAVAVPIERPRQLEQGEFWAYRRAEAT